MTSVAIDMLMEQAINMTHGMSKEELPKCTISKSNIKILENTIKMGIRVLRMPSKIF